MNELELGLVKLDDRTKGRAHIVDDTRRFAGRVAHKQRVLGELVVDTVKVPALFDNRMISGKENKGLLVGISGNLFLLGRDNRSGFIINLGLLGGLIIIFGLSGSLGTGGLILSLLLQNSNVETTGILLVGVDSESAIKIELFNLGLSGREERSRQLGAIGLLDPLTSLVGNLPSVDTRRSLQVGQLIRDIDELNRAIQLSQSLRNHRFVLNGVERTGGVDKSSTGLEKLKTSEQNVKLQGMQAETVGHLPVLPDVDVFAHSTISRARDITQDTVKLEVFILRNLDSGVKLGIVVRDNNVGR